MGLAADSNCRMLVDGDAIPTLKKLLSDESLGVVEKSVGTLANIALASMCFGCCWILSIGE